MNNVLIYGTGGVAVTDLHYRHQFTEGVFPGTSSGTETATASSDKVGFAAGGGVAWALSNNWSVKAEYLHVDFGTISTAPTAVVFPGGPGGSIFNHSADLKADIVRVGADYKF